VRSVAGREVRARPPSGRPGGSRGVPFRGGMTTLGFRSAASVATLGGAAALRHRGTRWRLRDWRLRTKLTAVLLVPLVLASVLGVLRVGELVRKAQNLAALARQVGFAQQLGLVVYDLQGERHRVAAMLATGRPADPAGMQAQAQRVDSAVVMLLAMDSGAAAFPAAADGQWLQAHQAALSGLSGLAGLRQATPRSNASPGNATPRDAVTGYSDLIATLLDLGRLALYGAPDSLAPQADGVKELAVAEEHASWQHAALLAGILSGGLSVDQQRRLRIADAQFDAAAAEFGQVVSPAQRQLYFNTRAVVDRKRLLEAALDRAAQGAPLETVPGDWDSAAAGTVEVIHQGETTLLNELRRDTVAHSEGAWHQAFWDGVVVAALLVLAVLLLLVVLRSLLQPLRALRTAAFEVADRRLPEAAEQLRTTDGIPGQTTVDPVPVHSREEVGQVARAFDTVHVQAVRLAAEQAQLRSSLNDVFLNLSKRGQLLVERQLQLIDELCSKAPDPELKDGLVQLDRLATRMRRHSENLLVLAGGTVRRGAKGSVPVLDVLSDAVSEIDEYQRVAVRQPPPARVAGPVANDLVHLIAELLDNATTVTPQGTMVTLTGTLTEDKSLLVEITDSGPGLPPDELQAINGRLALAPAVDASVSGQMGLFVVRELAAQHGITVRLRQRPGDHGLGARGLTATVLLPPSLVTIDLRVSTDAPLPLQVSVIDEATAADLFSPTSISPPSVGGVTSQRGRPRTAQEEWLELFGHYETAPEREPVSDQLAGGQAKAATATDPPDGAPESGRPQEVHEEIFEMVSAWFREQQSVPVRNPLSTTTPEWWSPFDEGWQAAQALRAPIDHEFTGAGLPKREPRAHLVSGADGRVVPTPVPAGPVRTPDAVRGRLSRYQRGLRVGRHARVAPDEQPTWTGTAPFEHGPFEENQQ
jgi:signal transduction histidine kinase